MKIKNGFILREMCGEHIVAAEGLEQIHFNKLISLNSTEAFLWEALKEDKSESDLVAALLGEYDVDEAIAAEDVGEFVNLLKEKNLLV